MQKGRQKAIGIFASDEGHGDPERSSIMAHSGGILAKQNAKFICFAQNGSLCVPLITAINNAGGDITIFSEGDFVLPSHLKKIKTKTLSSNEAEKYQFIDNEIDALIGLPGSLLSVKLLFDVWVATSRKKPVALLNKNKDYDFIRGFAYDIAGAKISKIERHILLSDHIEDLWHKLSRILDIVKDK